MLLDTNALFWVYLDADSLGSESRARIESSDTVHYSSMSIAEITIKHLLGKIQLPGGSQFPAVFDEMGLEELSFTTRHAQALLNEPELRRHDPFDRFLLAQAATEHLDFLTADRTLLALGKPWILDARR